MIDAAKGLVPWFGLEQVYFVTALSLAIPMVSLLKVSLHHGALTIVVCVDQLGRS